MKLKIINSGSIGNCYIFENTDTTLIVEVGVRFSEIKKALNFDLSKVCGAIVTHEHLDHSKGIKEAVSAGINVYASQGTIGALKFTSHRLKPIQGGKIFQVGAFKILPFDVRHDCAEPLGFIIHHKDCGNVLFITDSYYVPYTFKGLNNILIEANYSEEILNKRLVENKIHGYVASRVEKSHMSIETCKDVLRANDLKDVNNIVLIHLSDGNANAEQFKTEVRELTGKMVHVAAPNMELNFSTNPF